MTTELLRGQILPAGTIISPEDAISLGDTVRDLFEERRLLEQSHLQHGAIHYTPADIDSSQLSANNFREDRQIQLSTGGQAIVGTILNRLGSMVAARNGGREPLTDGHFYIGTAGNEKWHIDPHEVRLLVNLGRNPLKLLVATEWDEIDTPGYFMPTPARHTEMTYASGQGLLLDNACPERLRVPHAGVNAPNKVFFRAFAIYPVE